jgi:hypothetical protein
MVMGYYCLNGKAGHFESQSCPASPDGRKACCAKTTKYVFRPAKSVAVIVGAWAQRQNAPSFPDSGSGSE